MGELWSGKDPGGSTGAIGTMSDETTVEYWAVWTKLSKGYRLRQTTDAIEEIVLPNLHEVGMSISRKIPPSRFVVEGLFEVRGGRRGGKAIAKNSSIKCAEACGEVLGPLRAIIEGEILRPPSDVQETKKVKGKRVKVGEPPWRRVVLGSAGMSGDRSEAYAVDYVEGFNWPDGARPIGRANQRDITLTYAEEGALAESLCMAVYGFKVTK